MKIGKLFVSSKSQLSNAILKHVRENNLMNKIDIFPIDTVQQREDAKNRFGIMNVPSFYLNYANQSNMFIGVDQCIKGFEYGKQLLIKNSVGTGSSSIQELPAHMMEEEIPEPSVGIDDEPTLIQADYPEEFQQAPPPPSTPEEEYSKMIKRQKQRIKNGITSYNDPYGLEMSSSEIKLLPDIYGKNKLKPYNERGLK